MKRFRWFICEIQEGEGTVGFQDRHHDFMCCEFVGCLLEKEDGDTWEGDWFNWLSGPEI